jgi:hypothetical protein
MDNSTFAQGLAELIGRPSTLRAFVCDGSPLECSVFIVGLNPATASERDFWEYWHPVKGFMKAMWREDHVAERKKAGEFFTISPTRNAIERVELAAAPARILVTNIFSTPGKSAGYLEASQRDATAFDYLMSTIRPRLVIAHGLEAGAYLSTYETDAVIWQRRHALKWTSDYAAEMGRDIAKWLQSSSGAACPDHRQRQRFGCP